MKKFNDEDGASPEKFEGPQWDGSESDLVAAGDEETFEDTETGVRLSYRLKTDEVYKVLRRTRFYKKALLKAKIETVILGLFTVLFGLTWFFKEDLNGMIFTIVSAGLIGLVWATPYFSLRTQAIRWSGDREIEMEVYPDEIRMGHGVDRWEIPLDGSVACEELENMLVLHTGQNELTILPLRCIEPHHLTDVQARILSGTHREPA